MEKCVVLDVLVEKCVVLDVLVEKCVVLDVLVEKCVVLDVLVEKCVVLDVLVGNRVGLVLPTRKKYVLIANRLPIPKDVAHLEILLKGKELKDWKHVT